MEPPFALKAGDVLPQVDLGEVLLGVGETDRTRFTAERELRVRAQAAVLAWISSAMRCYRTFFLRSRNTL